MSWTDDTETKNGTITILTDPKNCNKSFNTFHTDMPILKREGWV